MWLDDMLPRDEASERIRTGELSGHQRIVIHAQRFDALARIDQQLAAIMLRRLHIDANARRRRDNCVVERVRRLTIRIDVGIDVE